MSTFTIYSKPNCPYCVKAKDLLTLKGETYIEYVLDVGQVKEQHTQYYTVQQLQKLVPNARTVPQIFVNNELIGGFDALQRYISMQSPG